jgi:hypothetical protein
LFQSTTSTDGTALSKWYIGLGGTVGHVGTTDTITTVFLVHIIVNFNCASIRSSFGSIISTTIFIIVAFTIIRITIIFILSIRIRIRAGIRLGYWLRVRL